MNSFFIGFSSSIAATVVIWVVYKWGWPTFQDRCLYRGIRVAGKWSIHESRGGKDRNVGEISLTQSGRRVEGTSSRSKTREGKKSQRTFTYIGYINNNQLTLLFEDMQGVGFDTGTYVFIVQNDGLTMSGMATFHGKTENRIVSEERTLKKTAS